MHWSLTRFAELELDRNSLRSHFSSCDDFREYLNIAFLKHPEPRLDDNRLNRFSSAGLRGVGLAIADLKKLVNAVMSSEMNREDEN